MRVRVRVRVRAAGADYVGVIAAKDQWLYFNCECVLRVRVEYELAYSIQHFMQISCINFKTVLAIIN